MCVGLVRYVYEGVERTYEYDSADEQEEDAEEVDTAEADDVDKGEAVVEAVVAEVAVVAVAAVVVAAEIAAMVHAVCSGVFDFGRCMLPAIGARPASASNCVWEV